MRLRMRDGFLKDGKRSPNRVPPDIQFSRQLRHPRKGSSPSSSLNTHAQVRRDLFWQGLSWNRKHGKAYSLLEQAVKNKMLQFPPFFE